MRALVRNEVPQIVAKALTFVAQASQRAIVAELPRVFDGGATPYTRNATRIEPATAESLVARVAVKDRTTNNGTLPEDYLFPQVFGGPRKEKRFERALRYAGAIASNERLVLARTAPIDSFGNFRREQLQGILEAFKARPPKGKKKAAKLVDSKNKSPYFLGAIRKKPGLSAIFYGDGGEAFPLLMIVRGQPRYAPRLDFEGIARETTVREFPATFRRLLAKARG